MTENPELKKEFIRKFKKNQRLMAVHILTN